MWVISLIYCIYKMIEESAGTGGALLFLFILIVILCNNGSVKS